MLWSCAVGFRTLAGVDLNGKWEPLFHACHPSSPPFITGSCGDVSVVRSLLELGACHSVCLAGINCQPFSLAGDRRGLDDPRSASLFQALQTAWLIQAPLVVLECTPEIARDSQAQAVLASFAAASGCFFTQSILSLQEVWCTKRERWYGVFSAPPLGPIEIPPVPRLRDFGQIGLVMPFVKQWGVEDLAQLELSLYELSKYYAYAAGGVQKSFLDLRGVLPTLLHSCGNQLYDCQCGCRKALSLTRLASRGLFGTLVALDGFVIHESQHLQKSRYLHPREMYLMQGGSPAIHWGENHRLAMAGIGQCVSPIQAVWILANLRVAVQKLCGEECLDPSQVLQDHIDRVLDDRDDLWPTPLNRADFCPSDEPVRIWDHGASNMISFRCGSQVTLEDFVKAQSSLEEFLTPAGDRVPCPPPQLWTAETQLMDFSTDVAWLADLSFGARAKAQSPIEGVPCSCLEDSASEVVGLSQPVVSPTVPFSVKEVEPSVEPMVPADCLQLISAPADSLKATPCPRLSALTGLATFAVRVLPSVARQQILVNQGDLWADDEIRFFLSQVCLHGSAEQKLMTWDPLALSCVIRYANFDLLKQMVASVPLEATVLSACVIEGHWYAICWRCQAGSVSAFTCGHLCGVSVALQKIHHEFCCSRGCPVVPVTFRAMPFLVDAYCGALAVAYLRHLVFGVNLPETKADLVAFHSSLRAVFAGGLPEHVPRPWIWGAGEKSWMRKLELVLQEHGVPGPEVEERAVNVVAKLGESRVEKALGSSSPWKDLKWIANSAVPPYQLIKPQELQAAVEKRTKGGSSVGVKAQKVRHHRGQKAPAQPKAIDPAGLRLESGLFECGNHVPLQQIDLAHVGPQVSGMVLTTLQAALPFLRGGKQVSAGGLGLLVVDCVPTQVPTVLIPEPIRIPAICVANSEPVLLDAVLYQLGALPVARKQAEDLCAITTQASCVVKLLAFRDQLDVPWEEFTRHPVRHLFAKVPPLQPCTDRSCEGQCEAWHVSEGCPLENPLLEVWGKQWQLLNFSQVPAQQAEVFVMHIRVPSCLAVQLQTYSGNSGVFLEPKHLDGKQASDQFQVYWMPRMSLQEVQHIRQTTPHVLGLARLGSRLGVRCRSCHAQEVHSLLRPGGFFLPPGRKMVFLLGPLPFGVLRESI